MIGAEEQRSGEIMIQTINPTTGEPIQSYEECTKEEMGSALEKSMETWLSWRERSMGERAKFLFAAADQLEANRDRYARLMTEEMGKVIAASEAEVDKCAWVCRHYAENADRYLAPQLIDTDASKSYIRHDPIGPVLAVMPWNFPFWQVFRFAAPSLMAGNVGLLKHASCTTGCSLAIEEVFRLAGLPEGCFQSLIISSGRVGEIIADDRVKAVTLTGSEPAGQAVASAAGSHIKKTVMELGGSDPFVVLADADIDKAAEQACTGRMINTGQSCIAAKRFIVRKEIHDEFVDKFTGHIKNLRIGDPRERDTDIGPLAREDLVDELHDQVGRSVKMGSKVVVGGERLDRPGFYYAPTLLDNVRPEHAVGHEETFGPVAAVLEISNDDEAIAVANSTSFGLGAAIWTEDLNKAERLAARIDAGNVFINGFVKSDPRLPFGGVKRSGYGRELGRDGIREFVNIKTVWVG
jgi:succinate-semialdehyde dehydrogenase/glutarate-semialdehyde dehydrogenase